MTEVNHNLMVSTHYQQIFSQIMDLGLLSLKLRTTTDVGPIPKIA